MNTSGTQLSDLFHSLQIRVRVMEELLQSTKAGLRPEDDFKGRFMNQAWILATELKKIKPLVDTMLEEGNALVSPIRINPEKEVLTFKC
jgi:hypothetical protein